ncbi:MAG: metallophosphoesterase [Chloroflexota bacterium]
MPLFFKRSETPGSGFLRIIQAADFHGSTMAWRKFMAAAKQHRAQHAIVSGDLTGKAIVPIIRRDHGYEGWLFGNRELAETDAELAALKAKIEKVGFYDHVCDLDEARALEADSDRLHRLFVEKMNDRLQSWLEFASEYLQPLGIPLWVIPGNDDDLSVDPILNAAQYARNVDHQVVEIDEHHELVSMGDTSMTPWECPRDYPEEHMRVAVRDLVERIRNPAGAIFNFHCPPFNTKIDQAPALKPNLEIVHEAGQVMMTSAGSSAIRKAIEEVQPLLSLHGHIHEARGVQKLGRTVALNPGSEYAEGVMKAAIVNLEPARVKGYLLISG